MMKQGQWLATAAVMLCLSSGPALAQQSPVDADGASSLSSSLLAIPADTPVPLAFAQELSSRTARVGDTVALTVARDIFVNSRLAIPRGSAAVAEVTWRTGRGIYGKSGKMTIALRYVEVNGQRILLHGNVREDGKGAGLTSVAVAVVGGLIAGGIVTGSHATIIPGQLIDGLTIGAQSVRYAAPAPRRSFAPQADYADAMPARQTMLAMATQVRDPGGLFAPVMNDPGLVITVR